MNYFKHLPLVLYNGNLVRNIISRVSLGDESSLLEYEVPDHIRTDTISKKYYDSYDFDWLVKLSSKVIDPYFDTGISARDFEKFIKGKYGSLQLAEEKVMYFENNWKSDDSIIGESTYSALSDTARTYWSAKYDYTGNKIGYERAPNDHMLNTLQILKLEVANNTYNVGDIVRQSSSGAYGELVSKNSTYLYLVKVLGFFELGNALENASSVISSEIVSKNVPDECLQYWDPVNAYEYEDRLNNEKRKIKLLDNRLKGEALEKLKETYG